MIKKKNILIVTYSYPPSNAPAAQRPYAFAKYLDKTKFNVTVLTCANQDSSLGIDNNLKNNLQNVTLIKVKSIAVSSFRNVKKSSMKNGGENLKRNSFKSFLFKLIAKFIFPDKAVLWLPYVLPFIIFNKAKLKADIIFSTSPLFTNHLVARLIKLFNRKAIHISDFRDYHYIKNENQTGFKGYLNKLLEKRIIKKSDMVCFISESMKKVYSKCFSKYKHKFKTIYNGFDKEEYSNFPIISKEKKLTFFYAGSFYEGVRSPKPLLLTLEYMIDKKLLKEDEFCIEIAGNFEDNLVEELKRLKVFKNILFLGLLPRELVLKKYKESHVLWLIIGNKINHYTGVPIKMYEYLGSKRPILNFTPENSESAIIIKQLNVGWNLQNDINNIESKAEVLFNIVEMYREGKLNTPLKLKGAEKFLRKNQALELKNLLDG